MSVTTRDSALPAASPAAPRVPIPTAPARELWLDPPRPPTRGPVLIGLLATVAFVGGLCAWSFLAPLSEAAIAPGTVKSEGSRRTVAHLEGGIVREILVRDGDRVRVGQILLRLDDVQALSSQEALRAQRWALLAQDSRVAAEIADAPAIAFPDGLLRSADPRAREAMDGQRVLFASRQASLRSQLQVLEARVAQHHAAIASSEAQAVSQRRQLGLLRREEADVRTLVSQGLERMPRLLALQRQLAAVEGTIADLAAQEERARASVAEARHQAQGVSDQRLQEASAEARDVRARLAELDERLRAADDISARREIAAPEDGVVLNSRFFNPGAVVRAGEAVLDLVPERDRLVAEVHVSPTDIDAVHPGLRAELRLPAFKQRTAPFVFGEVKVVAGDVTTDERAGMQYYRVTVEIDGTSLLGKEALALRPGMPVEAQILIAERSLFRYLAQPMLDSFHRAFREP